jgi:hypothetical protein
VHAIVLQDLVGKVDEVSDGSAEPWFLFLIDLGQFTLQGTDLLPQPLPTEVPRVRTRKARRRDRIPSNVSSCAYRVSRRCRISISRMVTLPLLGRLSRERLGRRRLLEYGKTTASRTADYRRHDCWYVWRSSPADWPKLMNLQSACCVPAAYLMNRRPSQRLSTS